MADITAGRINATASGPLTQSVAYTGTSAGSISFGAQTYYIRLASTSACAYRVGSGSQTAVTTDTLLPVNWVETVKVTPGQFIAAITAPTSGLVTSTNGTLSITELTQ